MFFALPPASHGANTLEMSDAPATYSWPWGKQGSNKINALLLLVVLHLVLQLSMTGLNNIPASASSSGSKAAKEIYMNISHSQWGINH